MTNKRKSLMQEELSIELIYTVQYQGDIKRLGLEPYADDMEAPLKWEPLKQRPYKNNSELQALPWGGYKIIYKVVFVDNIIKIYLLTIEEPGDDPSGDKKSGARITAALRALRRITGYYTLKKILDEIKENWPDLL